MVAVRQSSGASLHTDTKVESSRLVLLLDWICVTMRFGLSVVAPTPKFHRLAQQGGSAKKSEMRLWAGAKRRGTCQNRRTPAKWLFSFGPLAFDLLNKGTPQQNHTHFVQSLQFLLAAPEVC